jgi:hypothetical protein
MFCTLEGCNCYCHKGDENKPFLSRTREKKTIYDKGRTRYKRRNLNEKD